MFVQISFHRTKRGRSIIGPLLDYYAVGGNKCRLGKLFFFNEYFQKIMSH